MISCSQALPEIKTNSCSVIFDYQSMDLPPTARLAVFVETSTNVRRVEELEVTSLASDYVWEITNPSKIEIQGRQYAGYSELIVPSNERIPSGKYTIVCTEADSDKIETFFNVEYEKELYSMKASEIEQFMLKKSGRKNILIYDSGRSLVYYGEMTPELSDNRKIWNQYRNAAFYNVVWVKPDKSVMCVMPEEKVTPSTAK